MESWKTPTREKVDRAVASLTRKELARYFFLNLENPNWVTPLQERGYFQPLTEYEARYLARMAEHVPAKVQSIIVESELEHPGVRREITDAMLNMSAEIAVQLLEDVREWTKVEDLDYLLADKLGQLAVHFANGGQVLAATELVESMFEILPDSKQAESGEDASPLERIFQRSPNPGAHLDAWHYDRLLKKYLASIVETAQFNALETICGLLDNAIRYSRHSDDKDPSDRSQVWRPAVEDHAQNLKGDLKNALVDAVRDSCDLLVRDELADLEDVIEYLEVQPWPIFQRIALLLLREFDPADHEFIARRLLDRSNFDDQTLMHEYALLLQSRFASLSSDEQATILQWIQDGPDLSWLEGGMSADEAEEYRRGWQLRRLTWLHEELPDTWQQHYEALVTELGEPEHPEFPVYHSTAWIGPDSPKKADELQLMTNEELIDFLSNWQPEPQALEPSIEGLARELQACVKQYPERFAESATAFRDLDPTYIRHLLEGLTKAAKEGASLDWQQILELCEWVSQQQREFTERPQRSSWRDSDPHWGWTRQAIARLLQTGFDNDLISLAERERIVQVLARITEDPDPSVEHEERYGPPNMKWYELSINTTRGEALHSTIRYALWLHEHGLETDEATETDIKDGDPLHDVKKILEAHLDPTIDPSSTIRAVYGWWFPQLVELDEEWARNLVNHVFPLVEAQNKHFEAAWEAYLILNRAYAHVFDLLQDQYEHAVGRLDSSDEIAIRQTTPEKRVAEHLMVLYWQGHLQLDSPLLVSFWENSPSELRGAAIEFIGRSLRATDNPISDDIIQRIQELWTRRLELAQGTPDEHLHEMAAFGWWFTSDKLDPEWALNQLREALLISGRAEPDHLVLQQLVSLVPDWPREVIECLQCIIRGDQRWEFLLWSEEIRDILSASIDSGDNESRRNAVDLINYLGSRGHHEFRDLLPN